MALRLREFTNAEEQLGLLRRIIDSTWTAIADEAAEQKKQQELERIKASKKPRGKRTKTASRPRPQPIAPETLSKPNSATVAPNTASGANLAAQTNSVTTQPQVPNSAVPQQSIAATAANSASTTSSVRPYAGMALRKQWGVE
jgi:hypothetical protein